MSKAWLVVALLFSLPAAADPLKAVNAQDVRVPLGARPQRALGVRGTAEKDGWRLQLRAPSDGTVQVFDVTPGTAAVTFNLRLIAGLISFDMPRFAAGHTYHVEVRGKGTPTATGLVYLYPDAPSTQPSRANATRVKFEDNEPAAPASDEIVVEKKGSL
jgi:hypothetical protein